MTLREAWEQVKEGITYVHSAEERQAAEEGRIKQEKWDRALHQADLSSGSETLDD